MSLTRVESRSSNSGSDPASFVTQASVERDLGDYNVRVESFDRYPPPMVVNMIHLAKSGFVYNPIRGSLLRCSCVGCGKVVDSWKEGDEPFRQVFHEAGCPFITTERVPSESGSSLSGINDEFQRATVGSGDEQTKPYQTAGSSNAFHGASNMPFHLLPGRDTHSYVSPRHVKREHMSPRAAVSYSPGRTVSMTRLRSRDEHGRTTDVAHIRQEHGPQSLEPFGHSPTHSFSSAYPSTIPGSELTSGAFSNLTSPEEVQRRTLLSHPQDESHLSRLDNPDEFSASIDSLDMRIAQNRLTSFEQFWDEENEFRNVRLLVHCGFYCIGQGDAVECFCCHIMIANWQRNDNPRHRHEEMSPECRFMRGEPCGDIPLSLERRQPGTPTRYRSRLHSSPHESLAPPRSPSRRSASAHSSPNRSLISHPSLQGAAAPAGPASGTYSQPSASIRERSNLMFPCLRGANEEMRSEQARLQTFTNANFRRNTQMMASNETLAKAGLYYLGNGDSVKCWFCGGGLRDFAPDDDPWQEHAKFYPHCEHLLQQRGPEWISSISERFPNTARPTYPRRDVLREVVSSPTPLPPPPPDLNPQQREEQYYVILAEGMQSEPAQAARDVGYSEDRIRAAQWDKILVSGCCYQTSEALINAIIGPDHDNSVYHAQVRSSNTSNQGNVTNPRSGAYQRSGVNQRNESNWGNSSNQRSGLYCGNASNQRSGSNQGNAPSQRNTQNQGNLPNQGNTRSRTIHIHGGNFVGPGNITGLSGGTHYGSTVTIRQPQSTLTVNGQPFNEYMQNAFDHPFFHGEMDHLLNGGAAAVIESSELPYTQVIDHFGNPININPTPSAPSPSPAAAPTAPVQPQVPTARPPTPPPLGAIEIPRLPGRSSATSSSTSTTNISSTTSATTTSPSTSTATATVPSAGGVAASAAQRLEQLEREKTCKICLTEEANILFQPCGHICSCFDCSRRVTNCPVCRARITTSIRTYMS